MRRVTPVFLILLLACGPFFYQAPPSLGTYPERIAAKRWQHLFAESSPLDPALPAAPALDETCRLLPETLTILAPEKRLAEIDRLLAENRNGPYSSRRANFLHELRELADDDSLFDAAKSYLAWRVNHDTALPAAPPAVRPWDMEENAFNSLKQIHEFQIGQRLTFFKEQLAEAKPEMEPYWRVRRAALLFELGRHAEAEAEFSEIARKLEIDHPRAEVASLMVARCKIEQSRTIRRADQAGEKHDEIFMLLSDAETALTSIITQRPKGRFTPDAHGWLGAIAFDRGLLGIAVKHQLARLDLQPTREITRTVLRECDRIFEKLLESREPGPLDPWMDPSEQFNAAAVARHPLVARLFVQHCIDPAAHISLPMWWDDSESGDRGTIDFLKRRILNPNPFARATLTALGGELLKANTRPDAVTLTLLAWAATEEGEHDQALALLDQAAATGTSDETLLARAIVLQRLDRHAEAAIAFGTLAQTRPDSPLADDVPFRKSLSLFKSGQHGAAILEILPIVFPANENPDENSGAEKVNLHPSSQLIQWLDSLVQFAPLDQLELAFAGASEDIRHRDLLRNAIRTRALAARRFDLAERHLTEDPAPPEAESDWWNTPLATKVRMNRAGWDNAAAPLAALYADLAKSPPASALAKIHLAIARHWLEHRGSLALPSLALCYYAASEEEKQELLRRRNALELGYPRDRIHDELDHRDEATHAFEHALEAAKSDDPSIAAPALELANQCLFRRSEFSLYQKSRAMETAASRISADLHRQLRERFPASPEAKRSVFFTFTPAAGPWMPGDYNPSNSASAMIGALDGYDLENKPDDAEVRQKIDALPLRFENIDPKIKPSAILREIDAAQRELAGLRAPTDPEDQADIIRVIDRLDDLRAAASLTGISGGDFLNYANGNRKQLPPAFASLLEFRDRLKSTTDPDGMESGPKDDTIEGWRVFLDTYPDSPKAEAASFRMTRLIARKFRGSPAITAFHFPDAPIANGYKHVSHSRMDPATDPDAVIVAIRDHELRFPAGRYRDDLNLFRAGALIDSGKFRQALALLETILSTPAQRDLHVVALLESADIAQRLLDPEQRAAAAKAFRSTPGAIARLRLLVDGDTFLSRLKPLVPWLEQG
jgi:hypothetical protein